MTLPTRPLTVTINGRRYGPIDVPEGLMMIDVLHEMLGLTGSRLGCGIGICHACVVIWDRDDVTSEEVQTCSFQCGYCTPGFVNAATVLVERLKRAPVPRGQVEATVAATLEKHICRCTGYAELVEKGLLHRGELEEIALDHAPSRVRPGVARITSRTAW
jgi:aerobic-type carbon monoxide dehydrogenase small subunit (CoxS/CutS family)